MQIRYWSVIRSSSDICRENCSWTALAFGAHVSDLYVRILLDEEQAVYSCQWSGFADLPRHPTAVVNMACQAVIRVLLRGG